MVNAIEMETLRSVSPQDVNDEENSAITEHCGLKDDLMARI